MRRRTSMHCTSQAKQCPSLACDIVSTLFVWQHLWYCQLGLLRSLEELREKDYMILSLFREHAERTCKSCCVHNVLKSMYTSDSVKERGRWRSRWPIFGFLCSISCSQNQTQIRVFCLSPGNFIQSFHADGWRDLFGRLTVIYLADTNVSIVLEGLIAPVEIRRTRTSYRWG